MIGNPSEIYWVHFATDARDDIQEQLADSGAFSPPSYRIKTQRVESFRFWMLLGFADRKRLLDNFAGLLKVDSISYF